MKKVYYNDNDKFACNWLRELIKAGHLPDGDVDERPIQEIRPAELAGYVQCHFFAGIGGWALALRMAGWPEDRQIWTGSCPCQPFSDAGKKKGVEDERHLWPVFRELIRAGKPPVAIGEQVASKDGREWLAGVRADLEGMGYGFGAADLCAASTGAPHIRQRLYWVADAERDGGWGHVTERGQEGGVVDRGNSAAVFGVADTKLLRTRTGVEGVQGQAGVGRDGSANGCGSHETSGVAQRLGNSNQPGLERRGLYTQRSGEQSPWAASVGVRFLDGKTRRVMPGIALLANGFPNRVALLRGFGNAIVPQLAAEFIRVFMDCEGAQ